VAARLSEAARRAAARRAEPRQEGQDVAAVVLIGGFGVPSASLRPLARRLRERGHAVDVAPLGLNLDCGERSIATLERFLAARPSPVTLVGHSRGGQLARVMATRRPDLVDRLVTVGTPWTIGPPDRPGVRSVAAGLRALRRLGIDLLPSLDCATGPCCTAFRRDLATKPTSRWTAIWSSEDRVAGADSRPPAGADVAVDAGGSHVGLVTRDGGIRAVVDAVESRS
jgi:pimeloyl-ACP methyl ester carboxylesterase